MRTLLLLLSLVSTLCLTACAPSDDYPYRKDHLIMDCRCDPGTYEHAYILAGVLNKELKEAKQYLINNKDAYIQCYKSNQADYQALLANFDKQIEHNINERPWYIFSVLMGNAQTARPVRYSEFNWEEVKYEFETKCLHPEPVVEMMDFEQMAMTASKSLLVKPSTANASEPAQTQTDASTPATTTQNDETSEEKQWAGIKAAPEQAIQACIDNKLRPLPVRPHIDREKLKATAKSICTNILAALNTCMDKPDATAKQCFKDIDARY